ncbi:hypothetical protein NW761_011088 [Fusarium oxysporum]|nr:hypothetical protein NW758_014172 [Fusarium oxysporum]KAJ4079681.1 hypothetical protein NW761_011088 [Fusarium oxysporum]
MLSFFCRVTRNVPLPSLTLLPEMMKGSSFSASLVSSFWIASKTSAAGVFRSRSDSPVAEDSSHLTALPLNKDAIYWYDISRGKMHDIPDHYVVDGYLLGLP